jgi:hypothetical protein
MKPRHAAALALVGWYLMAPPYVRVPGTQTFRLDFTAPLASWHAIQSFDTAEECANDQGNVPEALKKLGPMSDTILEQVKAMMAVSQCISSDDPRLKGK